jgi:hypothetical protein
MPIGAKMYEDDKSEASDDSKASDDTKSDDKDEPIEGEVVDDNKEK